MIYLELHKKLITSDGEMDLDFNTSIRPGETLGLSGPSGAGKTSILRMAAGLLKPDSGKIEVNGRVWFGGKSSTPPQDRSVGFVFQDHSLFPNMSIRENMEFAIQKTDDRIAKLKFIDEMLALAELERLEDRKPEQLSGGQKRRASLIRALVRQPPLLLLDEPFTNIDQPMKEKLSEVIIKLHRKLQFTMVLVSHDMGDMIRLTDRMIVIAEGTIIKEGKPEDLLQKKRISGKFSFTGEVVKIEKQEVIYVVSVLIGQQLIKVIADKRDILEIQPGDKVFVASKAFNPIIGKL